MLPIPALDGGRVLILLIERITRRKINEKLVENIILASFVLLIGIFLFATYNDIAKMF
ncbi:site-2 protease family protein [uncultured Dubosiella sp.]|uniref:site-2 protease family protein n=1 Tax=uncultured Dubosiella sp. TaxID=1937011 RepID=UPI0025B10489|nr:site-2 protease family protein [uncultured Dubosiella sp.]